jgi:hypothetical protein
MHMRRLLLLAAFLLPLASPALAQSASTCAQYGTISVMGGQYIVQNNVWGASTPQCVTVPNTGATAFTVSSSGANQGSVASYPSIFKGCHWSSCTSGSGLPAVYSSVSSANFSWSTTRASSGTWDIAAEAWMSTTSNTANGYNGGLELMIWLDYSGMQPAGSRVGTATIAGASWEVWYGNIGWNYVAYRRVGAASSVSGNLKDFINDAISRGYAQSSWYLSDFEAGTEIMSGGAGFSTSSFSFSPVIGGGGGTTYTLGVTRAGSGSGTVTSNPSGISCGSTCSATYASGTTVTLSAAAASGSTFAGWSGACTGTGTCTTSMTAARSVTATFNTSGGGTTYTLSVARAGTGSGTVTSSAGGISCGSTCSASFASGTTVTLTAAAAGGSTFAGWSGACTGTGTCTTSMTANRSVTATFNTSGGGGGGAPCSNPVTFTSQSGNFNTAGAICLRTSATVNGWGCSNFAGRTVSVNGGAATATCGGGPFPLGKASDGYTYFSVSAGTYTWASLYTW